MLIKPSVLSPCNVTSSIKESATVQNSFYDIEAENKCTLCAGFGGPNVNTLDCGHPICSEHTKEQLEKQIKGKSGNIIYYCNICRAPKNLKSIYLTCGCIADTIKLDKSIRTVASADKIIRFDFKAKGILFHKRRN